MDVREEHRRHRDLWNRRMARRSSSAPRFRYQTDFYTRYKGGIRQPILDLGCGDGGFLELLCGDGWTDVYGIDISDVAVEMTRERLRPYLGEGVDERVVVGDMIDLPFHFREGYFNTVVCEGTLHQTTCTGARLATREIHKTVAEGGLVYLSVRSDSTVPSSAIPIDEEGTYRLPEEEGVVRCYFSRQGIAALLQNLFMVLEMEERELFTRLEGRPYRMWILVLRKGASTADRGPLGTSIQRIG